MIKLFLLGDIHSRFTHGYLLKGKEPLSDQWFCSLFWFSSVPLPSFDLIWSVIWFPSLFRQLLVQFTCSVNYVISYPRYLSPVCPVFFVWCCLLPVLLLLSFFKFQSSYAAYYIRVWQPPSCFPCQTPMTFNYILLYSTDFNVNRQHFYSEMSKCCF